MAQTQLSTVPFVANTPILAAASSTTATTFFIAPVACTVKSISHIYAVISTSGTLALFKDSGVVAPGGGVSILSGGTAIAVGSGGAVANTITSDALTATAADIVLAAGDRLSYQLAGTLTSLVGLECSVILQ